MAKAPVGADEIMAAADLKPLLAKVKHDGDADLGCALALSDAKEAVILMDRKAKPKQVRAMLLKKAKEVGLGINTLSLRFGAASVDPSDETVLRIVVNKDPAGGQFHELMKKRIKLGGFKDVIFVVDTRLDEEAEAGETQAAEPVSGQQTSQTGEQQQSFGQTPSAEAERLQAMMAKLSGSIKAAVASHPELRGALVAAVKAFEALLPEADFAGASHSLEDVVRLLKQAAAGGGANALARQAAYRKARADWNDAIEAVDAQIERLAQALRATGVPVLQEISNAGLNGVTGNHKVPLMAALMEIGPGSPETLAKSGAKALAAVRAFRSHIESDKRIAACDDNPLDIPVAVRATLGPALAELDQALSATA